MLDPDPVPDPEPDLPLPRLIDGLAVLFFILEEAADGAEPLPVTGLLDGDLRSAPPFPASAP